MEYLVESVLRTYHTVKIKIGLSNYPISKGSLIKYFHFQRLILVENFNLEVFVSPFRCFALFSAHLCFENGFAVERKHSVWIHLANNFDVTGELCFNDLNAEISDTHLLNFN